MFRIGVRLGLQNRFQIFNCVKAHKRPPRGKWEGRASGAGPGPFFRIGGWGRPVRVGGGSLPKSGACWGNVCEKDLWTHGGRSPVATQGQADELCKARRGVATRRVPFHLPSRNTWAAPSPALTGPCPRRSQSCRRRTRPEAVHRRSPKRRRLLSPGAADAADASTRAPAATSDWLPGEAWGWLGSRRCDLIGREDGRAHARSLAPLVATAGGP